MKDNLELIRPIAKMKTFSIFLLLLSLHDALSIKLTYDTIIVGMGSSGVTAASDLVKAGRRVLALEAQDRIGGRVQSVQFGDGIVELGGDLVEGSTNNIAYDTAMKYNIDLVVQNKSHNVFMSDGYEENYTLLNELINFALGNIQKPPKEPNTLGNVIKERLLKYITEKYPNLLEDQDFMTNFIELVRLLIVEYEGADDWNELSALTTYKVSPGLDYSWHRYGYETYHDILLNTYNNGPGLPTLDIKLNKEVVRINWPQNSTGDVEVICKDGDVYTADNVVVTVSIGVLKENYSTLFSPSLPEEKITAINTISIGLAEKVILRFDEEWLPNGRAYNFLWRDEERAKVKAEDSWTTTIGECVTPVGSRRVITCQIRGHVSKIIESLPQEDVKNKIMEFLRKFLGAGITVPEPTGILITNWSGNPYTRCSFTYDNLLIYEYPTARLTLGEPLVDGSGIPKVLFAGEATSYDHYATVDGASETGKREAKRILRYI